MNNWIPTLQDVVAGLTVAGMVASWFNFVVIKPLTISIDGLRLSIAELKAEVKASAADRRALEGRIHKIDESVKSAHKRIDHLTEDLRHRGDK